MSLIALAAALGCGGEAVGVGSKNFSENVFLGELIAQQIERRTDYAVERRLNLGGTFLCHQALLTGEIDVYPEYTGTALTAILEDDLIRDPEAAWKRVDSEYRRRFEARWMPPFGFNDTFAVLVREADAPPELRTISDLAKVAPQLTLGFNFEFGEREDGWAGLRQSYSLEFAEPPKTLDLNLVYQALRDRRIDVGIGNSTHGLIPALDLRMLEDDRDYFPPYDAAAVVRQEALERFPGLEEALAELTGAIDQERMREINRRLDVEKIPAAEAARRFLDEWEAGRTAPSAPASGAE